MSPPVTCGLGSWKLLRNESFLMLPGLSNPVWITCPVSIAWILLLLSCAYGSRLFIKASKRRRCVGSLAIEVVMPCSLQQTLSTKLVCLWVPGSPQQHSNFLLRIFMLSRIEKLTSKLPFVHTIHLKLNLNYNNPSTKKTTHRTHLRARACSSPLRIPSSGSTAPLSHALMWSSLPTISTNFSK